MRARLLLQILPVVALAIAALTAVAVTAASSAQRDAVYGEMSQLIGREANRFDARARADMAAAQDLAAALEADPSITREHGRDVVRRFAERRPELLGVWAAFEPNAFDGRDADYVGESRSATARAASPSGRSGIDGPLKIEALRGRARQPVGRRRLLRQAVRGGRRRRARPVLRQRRDDDQLHDRDQARRRHRRRDRHRRRARPRSTSRPRPSRCSTAATRSSPRRPARSSPSPPTRMDGQEDRQGHRRSRRGHRRAGGLGRDQGPRRRP